MFYDDNGVAKVAQLLQRVDESLVVTLVQAYGRLVEYIKYVDQLRAYLRGKAYALTLTT